MHAFSTFISMHLYENICMYEEDFLITSRDASEILSYFLEILMEMLFLYFQTAFTLDIN